MSERIKRYMKEKEIRFEALKEVAQMKKVQEIMTPEILHRLLDEAFRLGRYVGHCQGEIHGRELYRRPDEYDY